ncbi:hypothetical protein [Pseudomonas phage LUZ7]|uniref:Uncharacterized protein n=1 Tax=Pseudomonas phage LUZ7 TaxID=655097 RepID=C8ZKL2_9CAUD|nr:hypothetical protein PP-LUZ7_gp113 [Pseudomonas phage LUZ7]CAZ66254.1 hypothetical protein [Pseudomonas phage LUZ7]
MGEEKRSIMCTSAYIALLGTKYGKENLFLQQSRILKKFKVLDDELQAKGVYDSEWFALWDNAMNVDVTG